MTRTAMLAIGAAVGLSASPAAAAPGATGSVGVTAFVPEVCDLSADDFTFASDGVLTGSVLEFCNSGSGFQVMAMHRPLDTDEQATVRYGSDVSMLDSTGYVAVALRSGQRFENVPVSIDARNITRPLSVAFSLSAV